MANNRQMGEANFKSGVQIGTDQYRPILA